MFDIYKPKNLTINAEHLDQDVMLHNTAKAIDVHVQGGNYLIKTPDGRIYPANKDLFEYLFEKAEETNEIEQA